MTVFKRNVHLGTKDPLIESDDIANKAITPEKLADEAVKSENIAKGGVNWENMSDDVKNIIASREEGGVALSTEWGDSELIGITQKKLSEAHEDLQGQIDAIVNDKAVVSLSATPSPVFVGVESTISLVATTDTTATSIKIKKGDAEVATGEGFNLNGTDIIIPTVAGNTTYTAEFIISGLQKTATKNVVAVYPILYGAGQTYTDAQSQASVRTSPAGTYNVTVANSGDYVFFVVPKAMNISGAKMSGFEFPLQAPVSIDIEGVEYKCYQSSNTYDEGILTIIIS